MLLKTRNVSDTELHHCHFNKVYGNTTHWICACGKMFLSPDGVVKSMFENGAKC